ncbi:hypothetical protein BKG83_20600 [Mycobacteroides chelonae]|uniref:hypothetical protein n=1 Tax=Mycobacteroides chelonae TaxID=1774 RepID=UPI0008A96743|nr:hypothetical protein [Mycobacteroides chelonae]PKQ57220.1 hypothetical protein B5566_16280 [Mycobacterium sp. MHSD3]SKO64104.1 Uncharacterised protein [Mycobacteroides abscessus subsp. bolletii]MBF9522007.1 hypothetical protein [Mycobacteroides chelonae]MBV0918756.1 hypothetical protein [Mycobacteroides chelonae]OHT78364.1 hypothetical protein BKG69_17370 [Mycobacteroides chelonae]
MNDPSYLNFFVERAASDAAVVAACTRASGCALESDGHTIDDPQGYVQITEYTDGFRMGLCIIAAPDVPVTRSHEAVAQAIARELRQRVLFDIEDPSTASGERWILAMPDGAVSTVDIVEYEDGVGLA